MDDKNKIKEISTEKEIKVNDLRDKSSEEVIKEIGKISRNILKQLDDYDR